MVTYKRCSKDDYDALFTIQAAVWGESNIFPPAIFAIANMIGGVAIGAYSSDQLVGFVLSLPAVCQGKMSQWSCRLAVDQSAQNQGIGGTLKLKQKEALLSMGISTLMWSYNPYDLKNAHLNLNKLHARIVAIHEDMYPVTPSERAIVEWNLDTPHQLSGTSTQLLVPNQPSEYPLFIATAKQLIQDGYTGARIETTNNQSYYRFIQP